MCEPIIVLDFETTGLSPDQGDRVIEVGAVRICDGAVTDHYQSLMNPGCRVSGFIENYTGITNRMLRKAPPVGETMAQLAAFIGNTPLVAHNASFDSKFLDAELSRIGRRRAQEAICSVKVSRRVYPQARSHSLGALVRYLDLSDDGQFHRALADAQHTARLWLRMHGDLCRRCGREPLPLSLFHALQKVPIKQVDAWLRRASSRL